MKPMRRRCESGQAMTELLVALIALLPVFLAVTYLGKYGDLQSAANQASRYAAFQRALQPDEGKLSNKALQDEVRARFFVPPTAMWGDGRIQHDDAVGKLSAKKAQVALWSDLSGKSLLPSFEKVTVLWSDSKLPDMGGVMNAEGALVNQNYSGTKTAMVEVELFNKLNLADKKPVNLKLAAATAAAGNGWGSGGTDSTVNSVRKTVLSDYIPSGVNDVFDIVMWLFEPTGPDFGCIKPDVVPDFRLKGKGGGQACKF